MSIDNFAFNPETGFNDSSSFPDPASESETREQLFRLHAQTRDYINNTLTPALTGTTGAANIKMSDGTTVEATVNGKIAYGTTTAKHLRVNPTTNTLQYSADGTTWSDLAAERPTAVS